MILLPMPCLRPAGGRAWLDPHPPVCEATVAARREAARAARLTYTGAEAVVEVVASEEEATKPAAVRGGGERLGPWRGVPRVGPGRVACGVQGGGKLMCGGWFPAQPPGQQQCSAVASACKGANRLPPPPPAGERKSKRARKGRAPIAVDSTDTLRALRLRIYEAVDVHPGNARLYIRCAAAP